MTTFVQVTVILGVMLYGMSTAASIKCGETPLTCEVSYLETPEEATGNYPIWTDCQQEGEVVWTADGELDHIPDVTDLEAICSNALSSIAGGVPSSDAPVMTESMEATCEEEGITCTASFMSAVYEDEGKGTYPLYGSCTSSGGQEISFDGEIDHVPTLEELGNVCRGYLESKRLSDGEETRDDEKENETGESSAGCSQSNLSLSNRAAIFNLLMLMFR